MPNHSYKMTTPYGQKAGRGRVTIERDSLDLARVHLQLGEMHVELALAGVNLADLIADLQRVQLTEAELEQLDADELAATA